MDLYLVSTVGLRRDIVEIRCIPTIKNDVTIRVNDLDGWESSLIHRTGLSVIDGDFEDPVSIGMPFRGRRADN